MTNKLEYLRRMGEKGVGQLDKDNGHTDRVKPVARKLQVTKQNKKQRFVSKNKLKKVDIFTLRRAN